MCIYMFFVIFYVISYFNIKYLLLCGSSIEFENHSYFFQPVVAEGLGGIWP